MSCRRPYTPCGSTTTTIVAKDTCCELPDPVFILTSGLSISDTTLGTVGVSTSEFIHLYSSNFLKIETSEANDKNYLKFTLDFTDLSTQQQTDFCTLVNECVAIGLDTYTKAEVDALLLTKEDELTWDTVPTALSINPVTSGGLYTYVQNYFNYITQTSDDITEGSTNLFMTVAERNKLGALAPSEWTSTADVTHLITGTNRVSIGSPDDVAKLYILGDGNDVSTSSLVVENSVNLSLLELVDDGSVDLSDGSLTVNATKQTTIKTLKVSEDSWQGVENIVTNVILADTTNIGIIDTGLQPVTVTLPLASSAFDSGIGRVVTLKRKANDVTGNSVTIEGNGAETIDNVLNVSLLPGDSITVVSDGTEWHII